MTMQANLAKKDMSQYDNSWGSTTRTKDNEAPKRSDDPKEGGMPQYATQGSQQLDQKVNETRERSGVPKEGGGECPSMWLKGVNN